MGSFVVFRYTDCFQMLLFFFITSFLTELHPFIVYRGQIASNGAVCKFTQISVFSFPAILVCLIPLRLHHLQPSFLFSYCLSFPIRCRVWIIRSQLTGDLSNQWACSFTRCKWLESFVGSARYGYCVYYYPHSSLKQQSAFPCGWH